MKQTLFEIGSDLVAMDALLEEIEGDLSRSEEIEPTLVAWFDSITAQEGVKLDNYCNFIRHLEMERDAAKIEAKRYADKAKSRENRAEWLLEALKKHLERTNRTKVSTASGRTISLVRNGGALGLHGADDVAPETLPDQFVTVTVMKTLNKEAIRQALAAGVVLPGLRLKERGTNLRIT